MQLPGVVNLFVDVLLWLEVDGLKGRLHLGISITTTEVFARTLPSLKLSNGRYNGLHSDLQWFEASSLRGVWKCDVSLAPIKLEERVSGRDLGRQPRQATVSKGARGVWRNVRLHVSSRGPDLAPAIKPDLRGQLPLARPSYSSSTTNAGDSATITLCRYGA